MQVLLVFLLGDTFFSYLKALLCVVNDLSEVEIPSLWLLLNQDRNVTTGLATEFSRGELVFSNKR